MVIIDPFKRTDEVCRTIRFKNLATREEYRESWQALSNILNMKEDGTFDLTEDVVKRGHYPSKKLH